MLASAGMCRNARPHEAGSPWHGGRHHVGFLPLVSILQVIGSGGRGMDRKFLGLTIRVEGVA